MQLTLFCYCQEAHRQPNELPTRILWSDVPPERGQMIGMGRDRRWQIAQVYSFIPTAEVPIAAVHLALLQLPEESVESREWDCWKYRHLMPNETIHIHLEDVGLPELGMGFNCLGEAPTLGRQLLGGQPTGEGTKLAPVLRSWQIESYDTYAPQAPDSPYTALYLTWCQAIVQENAIAA